jgi:hypothetical protein
LLPSASVATSFIAEESNSRLTEASFITLNPLFLSKAGLITVKVKVVTIIVMKIVKTKPTNGLTAFID